MRFCRALKLLRVRSSLAPQPTSGKSQVCCIIYSFSALISSRVSHSSRLLARRARLLLYSLSHCFGVYTHAHGVSQVKGGGHTSNPGFSSTPGVQISMSRFDSITYDATSQTVNIGAGLIWDDVYAALEQYNVSVVGGRVSGVGVAGFTLGGGSHGIYHARKNTYLFCRTIVEDESARAYTGHGAGLRTGTSEWDSEDGHISGRGSLLWCEGE